MRRIAYSILATSLVPLAGCSGGGSSMGTSAMNTGSAIFTGMKNMVQPGQTQTPAAPTPQQGSAFAQTATAVPTDPTNAAQTVGANLPAVPATPAGAAPQSTDPVAPAVAAVISQTPPPVAAPQSPFGALGGMLAQNTQVNIGTGVGNGTLPIPNQPNLPGKTKKAPSKPGVGPQKAIVPVKPQPTKLIAPPSNKPLAPAAVPNATPANAVASAGTAAAPGTAKVAPTAASTPAAGGTGKPAQPTAVKPAQAKTVTPKTTGRPKQPPIPVQHHVTRYLAQPAAHTLVGRPVGTNGIIGNQPDDGSTEMDFAQELLKSISLGPKDENALGQSVGVSLTNQYGVVNKDNNALNKYVSLVGLTIASSSQRPDIEYVFGVLDTPNINAFSGPNGYIFVTRGALENMQDEAELAGVLAHEISHVVLEHGLQQVKQAAGNKALLDAVKIAGGPNNQMNDLADAAVTAITDAGYSQPQEFDADASAVVLMSAAGYNPASYLHFLQRMQTLQKPGVSVMSTHPGADQRVAKIVDQLQPNGTVPQNGATLADRFHANVKF